MENLLVDVDFRRAALELANTYEGEPEAIVARAETYYTFLKAGVPPGQSSAAPSTDEAAAPKTRRGRPPKDEAPAATPAAAPAPAPAAPPTIDIFGDDPPKPAAEITKEELRAILVAAQKASSAETVLALMKSVAKAETLGAIAKEHYNTLAVEAQKLIPKQA